jgi:hypothetical protein
VREAVTKVDPALTLFRVTTREQQTGESFARERLLAVFSSYFGASARCSRLDPLTALRHD